MYLKWFLRVVRSPEWKVTLLATFSLRNGLTIDMSMLNSLTKQIYLLRSHFPIMTPRSVDNVTLPHPKWKWDVEERSKIPSILVSNGSHLKYLMIIGDLRDLTHGTDIWTRTNLHVWFQSPRRLWCWPARPAECPPPWPPALTTCSPRRKCQWMESAIESLSSGKIKL